MPDKDVYVMAKEDVSLLLDCIIHARQLGHGSQEASRCVTSANLNVCICGEKCRFVQAAMKER